MVEPSLTLYRIGEVMTRARSGQLDDWEVGLVKRLWVTGDYNKQQIQAFFTRPDRSINQARITEIIRKEKHADIQPSSQEELDRFLESYQNSVSNLVVESRVQDPLAESSILNVLQLTDADPPTLRIDENDYVEWKRSFNWGSRADYAKTIVSFANNHGGYLFFGIDPDTKELIGIRPHRLEGTDSAKMSKYFESCFAPALKWDKKELDLRGRRIGLIYVCEANKRSKPMICSKQDGNVLREGDIFYRYPGHTSHISYSEMQRLLVERDQAIHREWMDMVRKIETQGFENVALLNTVTGKVDGRGGSFLIDESLLDQINFIQEGEFSVKKGAPTLKLIGKLETISGGQLQPVKTVSEPTTWIRSIRDFANQSTVEDPMAYVRALCSFEARWVPIFYFIQQAKLTIVDAIEAIRSEEATRPSSREFQIKRLGKPRYPGNVPARHTQAEFRDRITSSENMDLEDPEIALGFLKAAATLRGDEMELEYLLPRLSKCNDLHNQPTAPKDLPSWIRTAACVIDYEIFGRPLYETTTTSKEGG